MKKVVSFILVIGLSSSAWALSGSYYQTISLGDQVIVEFKVTAKDDKVRTEFPKSEEAEIVLKNDKGTFRYSPTKNAALKLPDDVSKGSLLNDMDDYRNFLKENNAVKTGDEKIGDYDTTIYEFNDPLTQKPARAWVWEEKGFPVKIEIEAPEGTLKVEITDIQLDIAIEDAVFEVPAGSEVVDLADALKQLPQNQ